MDAKIIFLGTGGDAMTIGKQHRASGGIILKVDGSQYHIDPGPGALVRAKQYGVNLRENTAVLVSHKHLNHANDVNAVISAMSNGGIDKMGVLVHNRVQNSSNDLVFFTKDFNERIIEVEPGKKIGINETDIHITETRHTDPDAVGFKFVTPYFVLSYLSDTQYFEGLAEQHKDANIIIINCKYPSGINEKGHFSSDDCIKLFSKIKPELAIITHFGSKLLQADPLLEARTINAKTGVQVLAATDGLSITPTTSYSAKAKQQRMSQY